MTSSYNIIKIDVVIPNFNGAYLLDRLIRGIILFEEASKCVGNIIIVDDASTDNSIKKISDEFPFVKLIKLKKHAGFANALNIGIENSSAPFVLTLNTDVEINGGTLINSLNLLKNDDIFALSTLIKLPNGNCMSSKPIGQL